MSPDFGKHLLEVEDLLQKHALLENDVALQAERVNGASAAALHFANGDSECGCGALYLIFSNLPICQLVSRQKLVRVV